MTGSGETTRTSRLPPDFDREAGQPEEQQAAIEAADLQSVLPRLSDASRTVLTLHYLEGFGLADIAENPARAAGHRQVAPARGTE